MPESFHWDGTLAADAATVWDAITRHTAGWLWNIEYEPHLGGAERGLTPDGGIVTAWQPGRHFRTRAERADGWFNELDLRLEPAGDQGTHLHFTQTAADLADDREYAQCAAHTDFYLRSLDAYLRWFAGRPARCLDFEVPGTFSDVCSRVFPRDAEIYYRTLHFLGLRTDDTIVRVFGRDAWGGSVGISVHLLQSDAARADAVAADWQAWADSGATTEAVPV